MTESNQNANPSAPTKGTTTPSDGSAYPAQEQSSAPAAGDNASGGGPSTETRRTPRKSSSSEVRR